MACLELETRLNRLVPPGATGGDPRRRADAVRDENTAARPLLVELETMTTDEEHRADRDRAELGERLAPVDRGPHLVRRCPGAPGVGG